MLKNEIIRFTGMENVPDIKDLNISDIIVNYELFKQGILRKRLEPVIFDPDLNTLLNGVFDNSIPIKSHIEPFYPSYLPVDIQDGYDYLLPFYGKIKNTDPAIYKLYLFYKTVLGWTFGENLVTDGGFPTLNNWTQDNWILENHKAKCVYCTNIFGTGIFGTARFGVDHSGYKGISQSLDLDAGIYWVSLEISNETHGGDLEVKLGGAFVFRTQGGVNKRYAGRVQVFSVGAEELEMCPSENFLGACIDNVMVFKENGILSGLYDDKVVYTANSVLRFNQAKDTLFIADNVNNVSFVKINKDNEIISAKAGIPAPKFKPIITAMEGWESKYFEEGEETDGIGSVGLIQCLYTLETEDGYKSNPSQYSDWTDLQWIKLDEDGNPARWLDQFRVDNIKIPDGINNDIKEQLKYFNFHFRILLHSEAVDARQFGFSCQKEIADKDGVNTYIIATPANYSDLAEYNNNMAPIAKDITTFDDYVVLSSIKDRLLFPFEFTHIWKMKLNNPNNLTAADGRVRIRLWDNTTSESKRIKNLDDWATYDTVEDNFIDNLNQFRIYDTDRMTPISVVYKLNTDENWCDIYVRISQIQAKNIHTLYFCFGGVGVDDTDYQNATSGQWTHLDSWSEQTVFQSRKSPNKDCLVCSPMNEEDWAETDEVPNKADTESNGAMNNGVAWSQGNNIAFMPDVANKLIGSDSIYFNSNDDYVDYGKLDPKNSKITISFTTKIDMSKLIEYPDAFTKKVNVITGNFRISGVKVRGWMLNIIKWDTGQNTRICISTAKESTGYTGAIQTNKTSPGLSNIDDEILTLSITLSLKFGEDKSYYSIYIVRDNGDVIWEAENDLLDSSLMTYSWIVDDANLRVCLGDGGLTTYWDDPIRTYFYTPPEMYCDQFVYVSGEYISNLNALKKIANFMPAFDEMIGYVYDDPDNPGNDIHNNNITFSEVKNKLEEKKNLLRWAKKGGLAYPTNYIKQLPLAIRRIMYSLSTLRLQSQNVINLYLQNGLFKFIAEGNPSTWAGLTNNLVKGRTKFTLVGDNSIVSTPWGDFHNSEAGFVKWVGENFTVVSDKQTETGEYKRIDIPLDKDIYAWYCPLRRQIILQSQFGVIDVEDEDEVVQSGFIEEDDGDIEFLPDA